MRSIWSLALQSAFTTGCVFVCGFVSAQALPSHGFMAFVPPSTQTTYLIGIQQGSALSREVGGFRGQGYYSSNGKYIDFNKWYQTEWTDLQLTWLTEMHPQWGLIWGVSTGEKGSKYRISPSLQLVSCLLKKR